MVLNGAMIVLSSQAMNNAKMPCLDRALEEVADASDPTDAPDQSGVCSTVSRPAQRCPGGLGRARRACGHGTGDALRLVRRVTGVHAPRADGGVGTVKRGERATGAARGHTPGETIADGATRGASP